MSRPPQWISRLRAPGKTLGLLFVAAHILTLAVLAVSPGHHRDLHKDAHHPEHVCAVTFFSQGFEPASAAVDVPTPQLLGGPDNHRTPETAYIRHPRFRLQPITGPPAKQV